LFFVNICDRTGQVHPGNYGRIVRIDTNFGFEQRYRGLNNMKTRLGLALAVMMTWRWCM
jgi:hypothetical protein